MHRHAIGIDIGGSSIKAAIVDLHKGCLVGERRSVPSPAMSAVSEMLHAMVAAVPEDTAHLAAGVTFPGVVVGGTVYSAANVAKSWIGQPLADPAAAKLKRKVVAINDADAAGLAEVNFGAARDVCGTVLVLSLGTGIGSALFLDGKLVPNTELGHLEFDGMEAETRASGRARMERKLDWTAYMTELNYVLNRIHALFWPDLFVLCGGITADHPNLCDDLRVPTKVKLGALRADAGIVGAAFATTLAQGVWIEQAKEVVAAT
ncbi:MAG TPA: ROK family protein [Steroidobacteraceae bacterium]|nr:ROK family protein [Steroidobacteraceae bacterium]